MKKFLLFLVLALILCPAQLFAQNAAKVIDVKGQVLVKKDAAAEWQKAKINMLLSKEAEVATKADSLCTLAFDEELKNILTLKENSHIKIEEVSPGNIFLQEGRVFSLIENLAKQEKFEIRTPTAIAGARGTGWINEFLAGKTFTFCFQRSIYFLTFNELGELEKETIVSHDTGASADADGLKEIFDLQDADYDLWNEFLLYIEGLLGTQGEEAGEEEEGAGPGEDIREEGQEDFRQEGSQERRREEQGAGEYLVR